MHIRLVNMHTSSSSTGYLFLPTISGGKPRHQTNRCIRNMPVFNSV